MSERKVICEQLDEVVVEMMGSMKRLEQLREKYSTAVGEGYLNMATARYSMGGTSVSKLQYDSVMTPLVRVAIEPESEQSEPSFAVLRRPVGPSAKKSPEANTSGGSQQQLRRRAGKGTSNVGVEDVPRGTFEDEEGGGSTEEEETVKDPLKWFGILLPKALPNAQQNFIEAITYAVEIAQTQARLEYLQKKYYALLKEKGQLQRPQL